MRRQRHNRLRGEAAAPRPRGRGGIRRFDHHRRPVPDPRRAAPEGRRLLPGTQPGPVRRGHGAVPARHRRRPDHPRRRAPAHRKAGPRGRHGLPVPPGGHHTHLGPCRRLRPGHLPHLDHETSDRRRLEDRGPGLLRHRRPGANHAPGRGRTVLRQGRGAIPRLRIPQGNIRPVPAGTGRRVQPAANHRAAHHDGLPGSRRISGRTAAGRPGHPGRPSLPWGRVHWR